MENYRQINLTAENAISTTFEIPPLERHMGAIGEGIIDEDKISIRVGNNPIVYNLKKLYELSGKTVPPEMQVFVSYDLWIVNFNVAVLKSGGWKNVKQLGLKIRYNEPKIVNIIETLPKTEFIKHIEGKLSFQADLGLNGHINPPNVNLPMLGQEKAIGVGGKLNLSTDNSVVGRLDFSVVSPHIMSVGIGSNSAEWIINKDDDPLYGDDITFTNIILVKKGTGNLKLDAMVYATISVFNLIPSRRSSDWMDIDVALIN